MKKTNKNSFVVPHLKYKKRHKGNITPQLYAARSTTLGGDTFGIRALEVAKITIKQNESFRRVLGRKFKKHAITSTHTLNPD